MVILALLAAAAASALVPPPPRAARLTTPHLAPRDVLEREFYGVAGDADFIDAAACARAPAIAALLADGDLERHELDAMAGTVALDVDAFVALCAAIDDLYEDEAAAPPPEKPAAPEKKPEEPAPPRTTPADPVAALLAALPAACAYPDDDGAVADPELSRAIARVAALRDETARSDGDLAAALEGAWDLRFTSSPSFAFHKGFTGVAATLPGGAEFRALTQTLAPPSDATYVETLEPGVGPKSLDVRVGADFVLRRRFDALERRTKVYVDCVPATVKYGPVSVAGNRVTRGWKAMRVLNSLSVEYVDESLRVHKGTTAWAVFTRAAP